LETPDYAGEIDADACHNFIDNQEEYYEVIKLPNAEWGLERDTSKEVKLRQPTTLDQPISQATLIHSILFQDNPTSSAPKTEPMDFDTMQVTINNLAAQVNVTPATTTTLSTPMATSHALPSSPGGKAKLIANNGCFRCRKIGHMASQCRAFPNKQKQQPRHFNNIEMDATPQPQQSASQTQS
ncbi:hypothetical protein BGZ65_009433, partial [Modicella reniformis]